MSTSAALQPLTTSGTPSALLPKALWLKCGYCFALISSLYLADDPVAVAE
jgi:hypothetical protein